MVDLTDGGHGTASSSEPQADARLLFDDTSDTGVTFRTGTPWVQYHFDDARRVEMYTLTSGEQPGDPKSWRLEGSNDGSSWTLLDARQGEAFGWRRYTRAFSVAHPGSYTSYRLTVAQNEGAPTLTLTEIELLGYRP